MKLKRVLAAGLMFSAFAATVWAQTDVTTTRVSGTVSAEDGSVLPGVTITATNLDTGLVSEAATDAEGFYRLVNLPTGNYSVTAALDGFATSSRGDVRLLLGSTPSLDFTMQVSSIVETIDVTSEVAAIEVTNTSSSTTVTTEQIAKMPLAARDFRNLVLLTPQTRFDSERGNLAISGQRGINTNVTIDGVDFNNAFFGGTVGGAEGRAPLSMSQESIKEFTVITNGASVEFGRSGGGFVNVITKSGTNNLHGSVFYYNQPQSLISDFASGVEPADQEKDQYGASIGGRIIADKLFYFLSYDEQNKTETVPIDSRVLDAAVFARYPELASPSTYGFGQDGDVLFGRLDWQASQAHRMMLRGNLTNYTGVNGTSSATTRAASYNGIEGLDTEAWVASYSGQWGNNLLNDLSLNYITEDTPRLDKGLNLPDFQVSGLGSYGEVAFLPIVSTTERKGISDTVTWLTGDHVLKFGGEYNDTSINQIFKGNWRGVFRFNSRADFLAGKWAIYNQFGGLGGRTADEAGRADFGQKETALFVQDQWFLRSNVTISAGVRLESQDNPNDPILNPRDRNPNGSYRLTAKVPDSSLSDQISPRFGITWAPEAQKSVLRFSAGRFWSRTPAILLAQLYTSNGLQGTQYQISAPTVNGQVQQPTDPLSPGWGPTFTVPGTERIDFSRVPSPRAPGVFAVDPNFENPYTDRLTLGFEREVAPATVVGIDVTYAEAKQLQRLTDGNLQYDGTIGANGLPRYSRTRPNTYYGRVTTSTSDAESKYTGVTLLTKRRMSDGFQYYAAITWSRDEDNDSNERNFAGIQAEDVNNLDLNYGLSNRDQAWRGVVNGLWDTGWWGLNVAGSFRYATGSAWTITAGSDVNVDTNNGPDRPTILGVHQERNGERQPDVYSLDLRVGKDIDVGIGVIGVFAECFNCTDAANRFVPSVNQVWGNANAATPSNVNFGRETGFGTPRTFQFGLRFDF